uniref:Uncharacterized protein n=1 Tax=Cacopsylla melanoneura TaxID=428564 RepID=A0A8D9DSW7_9HEMI
MDFRSVKTCCQLKCYDIIDCGRQKSFFLGFFELQSKNDKDNFLVRCLEATLPQQVNTTFKRKTPALYSWKYYCVLQNEKLQVCMNFLLSVLQIGRKRLRTIQGKFSRGITVMRDQRTPRTDVCDFCTECKIKLKMNPNDNCKSLFELHLRRFQKYKELIKSEILSPSTFEDNLILEFDFAQNLALPKLNINKQYYSRQLSLYVFNVHVHNDGESFLFYYMENEARNNSDAVCSMLYARL